MEDLMCWEIDYKLFAELQKAQQAREETRIKQERRAGVITKLLDEANDQIEKTGVEETSIKEIKPAK
jgi:hypothetical protein